MTERETQVYACSLFVEFSGGFGEWRAGVWADLDGSMRLCTGWSARDMAQNPHVVCWGYRGGLVQPGAGSVLQHTNTHTLRRS